MNRYMKKAVFILTVSFLPALSCKTVPGEGVPQTEEVPPVAESVIEDTPVTEQPVPPPVRTEDPAFNPQSITQEVYDSTMNEIKAVIGELNKICTEAGRSASAERSYNAWLTWLTDEYAGQTNDPDYLALLSQQPALKSRNIELGSQKDYFINVFAASRQNVRVDGIDFTAPQRVKVWGIQYEEKSMPASRELQQALLDQGYEIARIRNQNRLVRTKTIRYYGLEKVDNQWKIASLDED
jgi:hypothetical protein